MFLSLDFFKIDCNLLFSFVETKESLKLVKVCQLDMLKCLYQIDSQVQNWYVPRCWPTYYPKG